MCTKKEGIGRETCPTDLGTMKRRSAGLILGIGFCLAGCSPAKSDKPATVPVTGAVTLNEKPIPGATITFLATDTKRHSFVGTTDAGGKYQLSQGASTGAEPGEYKVVIEYFTKPGGIPPELQPGADLDMMKKQGEIVQSLPPHYSDAGQTQLKVNVTVGENVIDFPLKGG